MEINFEQTEISLEKEVQKDPERKFETADLSDTGDVFVVAEEIDESDSVFDDVIENVGSYVSETIGRLLT